MKSAKNVRDEGGGCVIEPGLEIGNYRLLSSLGRGGMGEVWEARHTLLDRPSAVKVIRSGGLVTDPAMVETLGRRFAREAQAMSRLSSPHTVKIFDFGAVADGSFYYAMELLDGVDLQALVERHGPLPAERVVYLLLQACESLAEAHRAGLVHRDIKPANLFLCRVGIRVDFIKVLDFGLVKSLEALNQDTALTAEGAAAGSPAFMAPEIALGDAVDGRADIYALGCVAYWLLTGRLLFDERTALRTLMAHVERAPAPPSRGAARPLPPELDALVLECLAKDPAERPQGAEELARRLRALVPPRPWSDERALAWWGEHMPAARRWGSGDEGGAPSSRAPTASSADTTPDAPWGGEVAASGARPSPTREPRLDSLNASRVPRPPQAPFEARREEAVVRLQGAFGRGDLTLSEYDERLELANRARDEREIQVLTRDLPQPPEEVEVAPAQGGRLPATTAAEAPAPAEYTGPKPRRMRLFALFGGSKRRGQWLVPDEIKVGAVFGGVELDLREAILTAPVTEVRCLCVFGGVEITVPPEIAVEVTGHGIFGGFEQKGGGDGPPSSQKIVRVSGLAVFGGVEVRVREKGRRFRLPWMRRGGRRRRHRR